MCLFILLQKHGAHFIWYGGVESVSERSVLNTGDRFLMLRSSELLKKNIILLSMQYNRLNSTLLSNIATIADYLLLD